MLYTNSRNPFLFVGLAGPCYLDESRLQAVLQIRRGNRDNLVIISHISQ